MQSPDNTLVGYGGSITDAAGNIWTITAGGQVAVNGVPDPTTGNVTHLAYAGQNVWQENTQDLWWAKSSPADSWSPTYGTSAVPVPIPNVSADGTLVGLGGSITDAGGNVWTITASGQVAVNGVADPSTANVTHLAYANGLVWQENSQDLWWSKSAPASGWSPQDGTSTVPVAVHFVSNNNTIIGVQAPGAMAQPAAITDASGNTWSITKAGQVAVNGVVDATTANVIQIAYVNGQIWQENSQALWWAKTAPADGWSPQYGTPVNPVSGLYYIANNPTDGAVISVGVVNAQEPAAPPNSVSKVITSGIEGSGGHVGISTTGAQVVITGESLLTNGTEMTILGAYRAPGPYYGAVENDAPMTVAGSTAHIGPLSGIGSIAASGSNLDIQSATDGNTIQLQSSHLTIGGQGGFGIGTGPAEGMSFLAPITMDNASSLTLADTQATAEVLRIHSGVIAEVSLYNGQTEVADLKVTGASALYASQTTYGSAPAVVLSATPGDHVLPVLAVVS